MSKNRVRASRDRKWLRWHTKVILFLTLTVACKGHDVFEAKRAATTILELEVDGVSVSQSVQYAVAIIIFETR